MEMEPIPSMSRMFEEATAGRDKRRSANIAFALASAYDRDGEPDKARIWGQQSVDLFEQIPTDTLEQVAPVFPNLGGISFPDRIYAGVVALRLPKLELVVAELAST